MNNRGFSLIELLLTISILAIFSTGAVIWFLGYQRQMEVESASRSIIETLRHAQSRTVSGKDFKRWGVYFDGAGNKFVLFRDEGGGYASAAVKEENYLSGFVKISSVSLSGGGSEIVFNKPGGNTAQYGVVRIAESSNSNNFIDITVSQLGKTERQ